MRPGTSLAHSGASMTRCGKLCTVALGMAAQFGTATALAFGSATPTAAIGKSGNSLASATTSRAALAIGIRTDTGTRSRAALDLGIQTPRGAQFGLMGSYATGRQWSYHCDFGCDSFEWWSVEPYLELRMWPRATLTPYGRISAGLAYLTLDKPNQPPNVGLTGHLEIGVDLHQSPVGASLRLFALLGGVERLNNFDAALGLQIGCTL